MTFKVGDTVRCIEAYPGPNEPVLGQILTVAGVDSYFSNDPSELILTFQEVSDGCYAKRFELVETNLKAGDRVQVTYEAMVAKISPSEPGLWVQAVDGAERYVLAEWATKLTSPIPTAHGAVIRINGKGTIYEHNGYGCWFIPGNSTVYKTEPQSMANLHGFTVLYAGDDS